MPPTSFAVLCAFCVLVVVVTGACRQDMHDQPRMKAYRGTEFFGDGSGAAAGRGTIARGQLRDDAHLYTGKVGGVFAGSFPSRSPPRSWPAARSVFTSTARPVTVS